MLLLFLALLLFCNCYGEPCWKKEYGNGPICACNDTYCDTVPEIGELDRSRLKMYYTAWMETGFNVVYANFVDAPDPKIFTININDDVHQKIIGFGAAFTDATGVNLKKLSDGARRNVLESYFGEDGIQLTLMRVPIGGNEFSEKKYTLDDVNGDIDLKHFELQYEDVTYKIPFILEAQNIRKELKLIGTSWTAPTWMKMPSSWTGGTVLRKEFYQTYANYMSKFFEEYGKNNITFWGVTTGNEPFSGFIPYQNTLSMGWSANEQAKWLSQYFAPTLKNSDAPYKDLKILIFDDGLLPLPYIVPFFLENDEILQYVDGIATHTNWDDNMATSIRNLTRTDKKDIFRISTHARQDNLSLGDWEKADKYIENIIEVLTEYDYAGWMDSNLVLDSQKQNQIGGVANAPILVDYTHGFFIKQPTFYAIGHFSKFVIPDSVRLGITQESDFVKTVAFLRPDGLKVVIVYNYNYHTVRIQIQDHGRFSNVLALSPRAINTILYKA